VSIKKGDALYYVRKYGRSVKGCYIRIGSTTRGMSEEQIEERWITSLEQKDYLTTITTNWKDITFNQLNIYYYGSGFHLSFETLVENLNLITEDKKYNKLAELLSDKNHIGFIFARFKGKDKSSMSETIDFGNQCIITAVEKIINRLEAENTGVSIITSTKRLDKKLVDIECLKEAIYNAVINNDWINNRVPIIYRFSDRIEILSYGGLPLGQTKGNFFKGISKPRSESLMRIMRDLGYTERTGHGVPNIVSKYGEKAFTIEDEYILVTLPFNYSFIENGTQEADFGTQEVEVGTQEVQIGTQEIENGTQENEFGTQENGNGTQEVEVGTQEVQIGTQEVEVGTQEIENGTQEVEVGTQENEFGTQENGNGTQEFNLSNFLYLITQNPKISRKEIADYFKISVRTLQRKINSFGNIKYVGSGKNGKWTIKKD